jgi:hypothetical protein
MTFSPGDRVRVYLPLDGPVVALRHRLDAGQQRENNQQHQRDGENVKPAHDPSNARHETRPGARLLVCTPAAPVQSALFEQR